MRVRVRVKGEGEGWEAMIRCGWGRYLPTSYPSKGEVRAILSYSDSDSEGWRLRLGEKVEGEVCVCVCVCVCVRVSVCEVIRAGLGWIFTNIVFHR